jgi:hypothetical protein
MINHQRFQSSTLPRYECNAHFFTCYRPCPISYLGFRQKPLIDCIPTPPTHLRSSLHTFLIRFLLCIYDYEYTSCTTILLCVSCFHCVVRRIAFVTSFEYQGVIFSFNSNAISPSKAGRFIRKYGRRTNSQ